MVEVIYSDIDAACSFLESWEPGPELTQDKLAVAFARHRIAAENAALERAAKVADDHCYMIDIDEWMAMTKKEHGAYACRSVATAIRAMKGPSNG